MRIDDKKVSLVDSGFSQRVVGRKEKERVPGIFFNQVIESQRSGFSVIRKRGVRRPRSHGEGLKRKAAKFNARTFSSFNEAFAPFTQLSELKLGSQPLRSAGSFEGFRLGWRHADLNRFRETLAPAGLSSCPYAVAASSGAFFRVGFF